MLIKINEFVSAVQSNLAGLIDDLSAKTGRATPNEREAWKNSLPQLSGYSA